MRPAQRAPFLEPPPPCHYFSELFGGLCLQEGGGGGAVDRFACDNRLPSVPLIDSYRFLPFSVTQMKVGTKGLVGFLASHL